MNEFLCSRAGDASTCAPAGKVMLMGDHRVQYDPSSAKAAQNRRFALGSTCCNSVKDSQVFAGREWCCHGMVCPLRGDERGRRARSLGGANEGQTKNS
jgi:hypothetical protein